MPAVKQTMISRQPTVHGSKTVKFKTMPVQKQNKSAIWGRAVCLGISPENPENLDFSENSNFIFSLFFGKIGQNPPGSLKLDPPSQDFQYEPNPSEFDRFRSTFSFFFEKFKKKWPKNETFFNFFPTPQPPGTLKPFPRARARHGGVARQSFIPIGPNGAPVMPI